MSKISLGTLPAEIIQHILTHLFDPYHYSYRIPNHFEYQLINRRWYNASIDIVYRSVTVPYWIDRFQDVEKLMGFIDLLRNPAVNVGQHAKQITINTENTVIWGALLKYCTKVEEVLVGIYHCKEVWKYIVSAQETSDVVLWKHLKYITCDDDGNSFYRFLHLFWNSLQHLSIRKIPNIRDMYHEDTEGDEDDLLGYINEFQQLTNLYIGGGVIRHIYGFGLLARFSPATLECIGINLQLEDDQDLGEEEDDDVLLMPTASQVSDAETQDSYPNLKTLVVYGYDPRQLPLDIKYLQKKFKNLSRLEIIPQQDKISSLTSTQQELEEVVRYLFSIKSFDVSLSYLINLESCKILCDVYTGLNKMTHLMIRATHDFYNQGVRIDDDLNVILDYNTQGTADEITVEELNNILEYWGPHIRTLELINWDDFLLDSTLEPVAFIDLMDRIILSCKHAQEVLIEGFHLGPCQDTSTTNTAIQSIIFGTSTDVSNDDFFTTLSKKLPNLNHVSIPIDTDDTTIIYMPSTRFNTVHIIWNRNSGREWAFTPSRPSAALVVSVSFVVNNDDRLNQQQCYYKYLIDTKNHSTASVLLVDKHHKQEIGQLLEIKVIKDKMLQEEKEFDELTKILLDSYTFVDIQCASLDELEISRTDGVGGQKDVYTFHM